MTPSNPDLLTTDEAAAHLCKSPRTLEAWRLESPPRGPDFIRIEGNVRYARQSLIDFLESSMNKPALPRAQAASAASRLRNEPPLPFNPANPWQDILPPMEQSA